MYNTQKEVMNAWPLGTVVSEEPLFRQVYCADKIMFDKIKDWFKDDKVEQISPHHVMVTHITKKTIEGYLYNGESWFPMIHNEYDWSEYIPEIF